MFEFVTRLLFSLKHQVNATLVWFYILKTAGNRSEKQLCDKINVLLTGPWPYSQ